MKDRLRVLLIEDDPDDALLIRDGLTTPKGRGGDHVTAAVDHVDSLAAAVLRLSSETYDVVILDLNLPDASGVELVMQIRTLQAETPIVVMTGMHDEAFGVEAVRAGAQDYVIKGKVAPRTIFRSLRYAIERHRLKRELEKRADALATSEARLRQIIASVADAIVITDLDGEVLFANPASLALLGRERSELVGRQLDLPAGMGRSEHELSRPDGGSVNVEVRVVPFEWMGRKALLVTYSDITLHKDALRKLEETRQQQLTMRDEFLSHVSHELRTPLTAAQQYTALLLDGLVGELDDKQRKPLEVILRNCRYLERMIEDLLEANRVELGRLTVDPRRTRIEALIDEAVANLEMTRQRETARIDIAVADPLPEVIVDPTRMRQVLTNLLDNAIKYSPEACEVTLRVDVDPAEETLLRVSVTDQGHGIPPDDLERIFERMYQRDEGVALSRRGLGLGLHICRHIVTAQGGRIWAESTVGEGSTFHFTVPVFSAAALLDRLRPVIGSGEAVSLIAIVSRAGDGQALKPYETKYLERTRRVLQSVLDGRRDLLLPRLAIGAGGETSIVVTGAAIDAAESLAREMVSQLQQDRELGQTRLGWTTRVHSLPVSAGDDRAVIGTLVLEQIDSLIAASNIGAITSRS